MTSSPHPPIVERLCILLGSVLTGRYYGVNIPDAHIFISSLLELNWKESNWLDRKRDTVSLTLTSFAHRTNTHFGISLVLGWLDAMTALVWLYCLCPHV